MFKSDSYDVIVVGGGPAGSLAAREIAQAGHSVLLAEKHREIGIPLCCAEATSLRSLGLFMEPDPKWVAAPINGAILYSPDGTEVAVPWAGVGVVLERKIFDRHLAGLAGAAGAEVMVNTEAVAIKMNGEFAESVTLISGRDTRQIKCRAVIGADGVESMIGGWAGMDTRLEPEQFHSCAQYLMSQVDGPPDMVRFWVGRDIAPGGYLWIFPKGGGLANVGLGIVASSAGKKKPVQYLDEFIAKNLPGAKVIEAMAGGTPALGADHPMVRGNVLLAGDAARLTDPLSGAGIAIAMASGTLAGRLTAEYLKTNDLSLLKKYPKEWWSGPWKDLKFHHLVREVFLKLSDQEMDRIARLLVNILAGKDPARIDPIDVAKTVIKSDPGILLLGRHLL
jgi:digeranylgeranylglycerophospholipid reductase